MKRLLATSTDAIKQNGKTYAHTVVSRPDGSHVKGTRSLNASEGKALKRNLKNLQEDIDNGAWEGK
jgi:hypothetical protein